MRRRGTDAGNNSGDWRIGPTPEQALSRLQYAMEVKRLPLSQDGEQILERMPG